MPRKPKSESRPIPSANPQSPMPEFSNAFVRYGALKVPIVSEKIAQPLGMTYAELDVAWGRLSDDADPQPDTEMPDDEYRLWSVRTAMNHYGNGSLTSRRQVVLVYLALIWNRDRASRAFGNPIALDAYREAIDTARKDKLELALRTA